MRKYILAFLLLILIINPVCAQFRVLLYHAHAAIEANMTGKVCKYIAYPGGNYNSTVITLCQNAGYAAGFTVEGGLNYKNTPLFELQRIEVDGANQETFKIRIGYYGTNYLLHEPGDGTHYVRWAAYLPKTSIYHVYAWCSSHPSRASGARYEIHHKYGITTRIMDQKQSGGAWNSPGMYEFTQNSPAMIFLSDSADGSVAADCVWFEPIPIRVTAWIYY